MKKSLLLLAIIIFCTQVVDGQIRWLSIEEAMRLQESEPKTVMIDMYTDWCGWCKKMDAETFSNPELAAYINANFYPVKFNAETNDTVMFPVKSKNEKTGETITEWKPFINPQLGNRSPHMLAQMLLSGKLSYPSIVYIDFEGNIVPIAGYMSSEKLEPILVYFAERINKYSEWGEYMNCYNTTFRADLDTTNMFKGSVKWEDFNTAVEKMKKEPKKLLLYIYSDWNSSSKLMQGGSFKETALAKYINDNFYAVKIPYDITDTLKIAGREFVNEKNQIQYPNQLVLSLLHPDYRIPAFVIFDEHATQPIFIQRGFSSYTTIEKLLTYFADDLNQKGVNLQEYYNNYKSKIHGNEPQN